MLLSDHMHIPWIEFGVSLFAAAICIPLVLRKVPRNQWYGMRTPRTMNGSDAEWYETNRITGIAMVIGALISALGDVLLGLIPISATARYGVSALLLLAAVLLPVLIYRKRLF
jgi:uncharacterized membrane protein